MITPTQFKKWFGVLATAFNKKLDKEAKDAWFDQIEKCDFSLFKKTIDKLMTLEFFPTFANFWHFYNLLKPGKQVNFCGDCFKGWIYFYKEEEKKLGLDYEYAAPCEVCHPELSGAVSPNGSFNYAPGTEPWKHRYPIDLPRSTNRGLLQELLQKMETGSVDWKKETEEAWARHETALSQAGKK